VHLVDRSIPGITLEPPDQSVRGFLVLIDFNWLFLKPVRKVFGEISVRT
jgi:high-affinity nickel permease